MNMVTAMLSSRRQESTPLDAWRRIFMRRRYQDGNVKKQRGVWIAQWWENGHRRSRALGSVWEMTKTEAKAKVAAIVAPLNLQERTASERCSFADFVEQIFLPFWRKWKSSTAS